MRRGCTLRGILRMVLKAVSEMARLGANHCICWDPSDTDARAAVAKLAKAQVLHQEFLRR